MSKTMAKETGTSYTVGNGQPISPRVLETSGDPDVDIKVIDTLLQEYAD